jgi:hypothetical protein
VPTAERQKIMAEVRRLRDDHGLSIHDAAVALGKSPSTIKKWCAAQSFSYTMKTRALQPAPVGSMTPDLRQAIADASAEIAAGTAPPFKPKGY